MKETHPFENLKFNNVYLAFLLACQLYQKVQENAKVVIPSKSNTEIDLTKKKIKSFGTLAIL